MAAHVKQEWDEQFQSDHQPCSNSELPRFYFEFPHQLTSESSAALPLFVPEPIHRDRMSSLSAFSDSTITSTAARFARVVKGFFSLAQWQELELQALIYKYMLVRAPVPAILIDSIKRSLPDNTSAFYLHHPSQQYHHFQQGMLRSGYYGSSMDPEPGRCRRTDGKKWRCSKDVVDGQKYCDRHMHRGRNRSRKPVESSSTVTINGGQRTAIPASASASTGMHFTLSVPTASPLNTRYPEMQQEGQSNGEQTLLPFFDDWSKEQQEPNDININVNPEHLPTGLSLKLATGNGNDLSSERNVGAGWGAGWRNHSLGGPLAEALVQTASSSSSPTSVLIGGAARAAGSE